MARHMRVIYSAKAPNAVVCPRCKEEKDATLFVVVSPNLVRLHHAEGHDNNASECPLCMTMAGGGYGYCCLVCWPAYEALILGKDAE